MTIDFTTGFSEYWRKNKSIIEPWEMVCVLRALKKVSLYITNNLKPIEWSGMTNEIEGKILIDPAFVAGEYPIPPGKMDALVGLVAHEAFHTRELSDLVWLEIKEYAKNLSIMERHFLFKLVDVAEDIFVYATAKDTIWREYMLKTWKHYFPKQQNKLTTPPSLNALFEIWGEIYLEGKQFPFLPVDYQDPLNLLEAYTDNIFGNGLNSISDKSRYRVQLYKEMWDLLKVYIRIWQEKFILLDGQVDFEPESDVENEKLIERDKPIPTKSSTPRIPDFSTINKLMEEEEKRNLTQKIRSLVGDRTFEVIPTFFWDELKPCKVLPDPYVVKRLKQVFEMQKSKISLNVSRINRGLYFGKIDCRRLYKASLDGKIFREKEYEHDDKFWNITILVDTSESMGINKLKDSQAKWYIIQKTYTSLYEAAKNYGNKLNVLAYHEEVGRCYILRLLSNNKLHSPFPTGRTPTGQAIIAAGLNMPKDRRRLIVHITDGEANCGLRVDEAIKYCEKEKIELVTIGYGYNDEIRDYFTKLYQDKLYLMNNFEELPEGLELLLKEKILKAG